MTVSAQDAHEYPIYNARFRVIFPLLDADGDLVTGATTPDSELSQDQGTFADATNEMTEIATSSGVYYLDLVAGEMDTKSTTIIAKSATAGMKTTVLVLHPRRLPVVRTGTAQAGAASTITLDSGASAMNDFYNGCWVNITNNSPANAQGQARKITDYVGSTKVATIEGTWGTNPDSTSTFEILANPEDSGIIQWAGTTVEDPATVGRPDVSVADMQANTVTAAAVADGAIDAATFAAGAINAAAIATGAIDADALAADASTEINTAVLAVLGALADAAADGDPTATDTMVAYLKQLINILVGSAGVVTFPAAAVAADAVSLAEVIRSIDTRLPSALATGRMSSDVIAISGDTVAADTLEELMDGVVAAAVNDVGATTTTFIADGFTEATNDHFNGRLITFIGGALQGQQTSITDYTGATQTFLVPALTEAPADNQLFVIH